MRRGEGWDRDCPEADDGDPGADLVHGGRVVAENSIVGIQDDNWTSLDQAGHCAQAHQQVHEDPHRPESPRHDQGENSIVTAKKILISKTDPEYGLVYLG